MLSRSWFLAPVVIGLASCQLVAGVETRNVDPILPGCTLPTEGTGQLRIANLVPSANNADFCIRTSGQAYKRPILRDGGSACPAGFAYEKVSAIFSVPAGNIDVEAIPSGSTCSATPLSHIENVAVPAGPTPVTILRIGGAKTPERLVASSETTPATTSVAKLRFFNANAGSMPLFFGVAMGERLPTTLVSHLVQDGFPFGQGFTPQTKPIVGMMDANGYLTLPNATFIIGEGPDDQHPLAVQTLMQGNSRHSFYAIGDNDSSAQYPSRALYCDDDPSATSDKIFANGCTETSLATLSVDVFNAQLYGGGSPWELARKPYIFDAIANRPSDLQCLVELDDKADRDQVISKAVTSFPYSVTFDSDLGTQPTDPADQKGNVPSPPAEAACGPAVDQSAFMGLTNCLEQNCANPMGASGILAFSQGSTPSDCISKFCTSAILPLYSGDSNAANCMDCIITNTVSLYPYSQTVSTCGTDMRAPYAFQGQTPSMILSRFPIVSSQTYVLPSSYWRRVVHRAVVQLEVNKTVDFYCAQLQSTGNASVLPYAGNYGDGLNSQTDSLGAYLNEQKFEMQRVMDWIRKQSGSSPAILAIDTHASKAWPPSTGDAGTSTVDGGGGQILTDLSREIYDQYLDADPMHFQHAVPSGWVATGCVECPATPSPYGSNPYNGNTQPLQWLDVYVYNYPGGTPATDVNIFANQPVVPLPDGSMGMLSATFGYNVHVIRP
jgi:hypothetical protein